jgi:hypothetical protein
LSRLKMPERSGAISNVTRFGSLALSKMAHSGFSACRC